MRAMGIGFGVLGSVGQMTAAASADGFGFAWDDGLVAGSELYFARMAFDATIATPPTRLTTDTLDTRWASIASNGTTFGITYTSGGSYAIWFTEVDRDGGIVVAPAQADPVVSSLSETVAVGSEYFGVWHSIGVRDLIFARIQTVPVVAAIKTTYTGYFTSLFSDITHDGTRFAMTWNPGVLNRIVFAQMDGTLIGTWTDVAVTPSRRSRAAIRALGDRYLVAWMDSPSPVARIALLDRSGATVAGPTSLGAVECPTDPCWAIPRVAASDDEFGVAFPNHGGGWWFQRITRTGSTLGERFTLTTIEGQIGLAAAPGGRYMMAGHTANNVLGVVINRP